MMVNHQHHSKADVNNAEKQNIKAQAFHEVEFLSTFSHHAQQSRLLP